MEEMGNKRVQQLQENWELDKRWKGVTRPYSAEDVIRLRGSLDIEYTLAHRGAEKLWNSLHSEDYIHALGALTGNQAMQQVKAGLKAIYLSGWQVAIVADAEAGFGGQLNVFELMKGMIEAGASGVHFEDQLSSEKKCGHLGGKVLLPTQTAVRNLISARLAADVMGVPTLIIARTDADAADLITSDIDPVDQPFITGERTPEGFFQTKAGLDQAIARGLAYAPYADLVWCETSEPNLEDAKRFAEAIHEKFPGKLLAYNCSPSFNWKKKLDDKTIANFQKEIASYGYKFQFVTLAGFHALNYGMFELARGYKERGMAAYSELQQAEFAAEQYGYSATRHQREVGTGYFDEVAQVITGGTSSTTALKGSTEVEQFTR